MTTHYFGHIEDMHGFLLICCFLVIRCSWNGRSTKLVKLISSYLLYLEWNVGMLAVNICILWLPIEPSSDDSVDMWLVCRTAHPPLRSGTPPPTCLVAPPPPLTHVDEVSFDDSLPLDSSGYNDECLDIKVVSLSIWIGYRFQLFSRITKCAHVHFRL
jgi:hypothetical protein